MSTTLGKNLNKNFMHNNYNKQKFRYPVVKFVGKKILKMKLSYEQEGFDWDVMWTDNAVQSE